MIILSNNLYSCQIHIDIPRTNPLIPLFQQPVVQEVRAGLLKSSGITTAQILSITSSSKVHVDALLVSFLCVRVCTYVCAS